MTDHSPILTVIHENPSLADNVGSSENLQPSPSPVVNEQNVVRKCECGRCYQSVSGYYKHVKKCQQGVQQISDAKSDEQCKCSCGKTYASIKCCQNHKQSCKAHILHMQVVEMKRIQQQQTLAAPTQEANVDSTRRTKHDCQCGAHYETSGGLSKHRKKCSVWDDVKKSKMSKPVVDQRDQHLQHMDQMNDQVLNEPATPNMDRVIEKLDMIIQHNVNICKTLDLVQLALHLLAEKL